MMYTDTLQAVLMVVGAVILMALGNIPYRSLLQTLTIIQRNFTEPVSMHHCLLKLFTWFRSFVLCLKGRLHCEVGGGVRGEGGMCGEGEHAW